jgi:hypothetical protein
MTRRHDRPGQRARWQEAIRSGARSLLATVALVVLVAGGCARQDRAGALASSGPASSLTDPSPSTTPSITFHDRGMSFEYPSAWDFAESHTAFSMGSIIAILGTADLATCGDPVDVNCAYAASLEPGDVRVVIGTAASPGASMEEPPGGFTATIDGMPGIATTTGSIPQINQDVGRSWQIGMPGVVDNWYTIDAAMRGPGLDDLRAQVDQVARSIRFDQHPPPLPTDPTEVDTVVGRAVQSLDRDARESYHSDYYGCFPRRVGESDPVVIDDGPGGPLSGPVPVRCAVAVDQSPVGLFKMTLSASWDAGPSYAAGKYRQIVYVDGDGGVGAMYNHLDDIFFPEIAPATSPGPPTRLEAGSLVEVLYPGVTLWRDRNHNDSLSSMAHGRRLWIASGPVAAGGETWYRVRWQPTPTYDEIPAWITDTFEGHAVVKAIGPHCPDAVHDVADLVAMTASERVLCFGDRELSLGPVTFRVAPSKTSPAKGSPRWLASSARIAMYGSQGPSGVDGALLVRPGEQLGELPVDGSFDVIGHFDDPAARACARTWSSADGPVPETKAEQELSCREQFVVTAIDAR